MADTLLLSTDAFDAYQIGESIVINEKKTSAKKFGIVLIALGIAFLAISYIPMDGWTYDWITSIFHAVFFWGGITLTSLGFILFILKGLMAKEASTSFDSEKKILTLRGKAIPFDGIDNILVQSQDLMSKTMTALILVRNGKKKSLINGAIFSNNSAEILRFVDQLKELVDIEELA